MPFTKTFHGFIENTTDTLLIIEACRNKILPTINRRLIERERSLIKSGTIIVFDETESGIKRWTDGFLWSPSRILGNFLVYRELANRETRSSEGEGYNLYNGGNSNGDPALLHQRERALVGSLTTANTSYNFKQDGLIKKTIRIMVNGNYLHIVSYYSKNDVLENQLPTPSASPQFAGLQISADLMPHLQGYASTQPIRKRSKSSDDENDDNNNSSNTRQRIDSCQPTYSNVMYSGHHGYYPRTLTPFTELPPPPHYSYHAATTAKAPAYAKS
ncbi:hypothetical protein INT47_000912, partial [Mucor saturninus]